MFQQTRIVKSTAYASSIQLTQQPGNMSPNILKLEGYYEGATPAWLQFFDSLGAPINTTVPLYEESLGTVAPNGYSWQFNPGLIMRLNNVLDSAPLVNGLIAVISTTQGALTIGTGSNLSSFYITLEEWENLPFQTVTKTGDTTTAITNQVVTPWVDGAFHTIDKIIISNGSASQAFLLMFCDNASAAAGLKPVNVYPIAPSLPLTELDFRGVGFVPEMQVSSVSPPVIHNGCYLYASTSPAIWQALVINSITIQCNWY